MFEEELIPEVRLSFDFDISDAFNDRIQKWVAFACDLILVVTGGDQTMANRLALIGFTLIIDFYELSFNSSIH